MVAFKPEGLQQALSFLNALSLVAISNISGISKPWQAAATTRITPDAEQRRFRASITDWSSRLDRPRGRAAI